jgi:hypothetical protein
MCLCYFVRWILFSALIGLATLVPCHGYELHLEVQTGQVIGGETILRVYHEEPLPVSINRLGEFPYLAELDGDRNAVATT